MPDAHASHPATLVQAHGAAGDMMAAERVLQSHRAALEKLELDDDALGDTCFEAAHDRAVAI